MIGDGRAGIAVMWTHVSGWIGIKQRSVRFVLRESFIFIFCC